MPEEFDIDVGSGRLLPQQKRRSDVNATVRLQTIHMLVCFIDLQINQHANSSKLLLSLFALILMPRSKL